MPVASTVRLRHWYRTLADSLRIEPRSPRPPASRDRRPAHPLAMRPNLLRPRGSADRRHRRTRDRGSAQGCQGPLRRVIGFRPNTPRPTNLMTRCAGVARQLGAIPSVIELDLRGHLPHHRIGVPGVSLIPRFVAALTPRFFVSCKTRPLLSREASSSRSILMCGAREASFR